MVLEIYGWDILKKDFPKLSFSKTQISNILMKEFSSFDVDSINIVFTTKQHIKELNSEFRSKDSPTDVLSFLIEKEPLKGEIYICSEYVDDINEKEVLRLIIHGFLHIVGYIHEGFFRESSKKQEDMFVKQEKILDNIYSSLNN